ncbi:MAG: hypothetical protein QOD56_3133, partial [Gammaproteobacteria bacterium]|nr:hypothetical protein [Gammaproteobacteria bacterium]
MDSPARAPWASPSADAVKGAEPLGEFQLIDRYFSRS